MLAQRTSRRIARAVPAGPLAGPAGILASFSAILVAACGPTDIPELHYSTESPADTAPVFTDTVAVYIGEPVDTVYLLLGETKTGREALRDMVATYREEIHLFENDPKVRATVENPDSLVVSLWAELVQLEADLAEPEWTPARFDSIQCAIRREMEWMRKSGVSTGRMNGNDVTFQDLIETDSLMSLERPDVWCDVRPIPPLRCL